MGLSDSPQESSRPSFASATPGPLEPCLLAPAYHFSSGRRVNNATNVDNLLCQVLAGELSREVIVTRLCIFSVSSGYTELL